jgi:hypothetical protein
MVIVGLIVLGGVINAVDGDDSADTGSAVSDGTHSVRYVVAGDSRQADVTYQNDNGDTSQESGVSVPWDYSFSEESGAFLYISAQRGGAAGDISCSIEVDGQTVETNTSEGAYTICTASDSL